MEFKELGLSEEVLKAVKKKYGNLFFRRNSQKYAGF